jgi:BirA family biotin operon repressor/biotin-[acetyl-CoA-carboxylase] ligase
VLDEYNSILCNRDSEVKIVAGQDEYVAKCIGIDENGRLIVERDGKMEKIDSGEVHVRGLYGYI